MSWAEKLTKAARKRRERKRDAAVLKAKAEGKSNRQIARDQEIDEGTVRNIIERAAENQHYTENPQADDGDDPPAEKRKPLGWGWVDWTGAIKQLSEIDADLEALAGKLPSLRPKLLAEAHTAMSRLTQWTAMSRLTQWIECLEKLNAEIPKAA
jgi:hypothetical protein